MRFAAGSGPPRRAHDEISQKAGPGLLFQDARPVQHDSEAWLPDCPFRGMRAYLRVLVDNIRELRKAGGPSVSARRRTIKRSS